MVQRCVRCATLAGVIVASGVDGGVDVYMGSVDGRLIRSTSQDGSMTDHVVRDVSIGSTLALAADAGWMYWIDEDSGRLYRSELNGDDLRLLRCEGIDNPKSLVASESLGRLYWPEFDVGDIRSVDLNGRNETTIASGLAKPFGLSADELNNCLYTTGSWMPKGVGRISLSDGRFEILPNTSFVLPRAVTAKPLVDTLYWIDNLKVRRATLDGTNVITLPLIVKFDSAIAVDSARERIFAVSPLSKLLYSDTNGKHLTTVSFAPSGVKQSLAIEPSSGDVLLAQPDSGIWRVDLGADSSELMVRPSQSDGPVWAIDTDRISGRVVWVDPTTSGPRLNSSDGFGNAKTSEPIPTANVIFDLMVDEVDGAVYLCESTQISRMNLDGTGYTPLFGLPPFAVAFDRDPISGDWYWISSEQILFRGSSAGDEQTLLGFIDGIADDLAIDSQEQMLYWLIFSHEGKLVRSPMGTFAPEVVLDNLTAGSRLHFDPASRVMYWTDATEGAWSWAIGDASPTRIPVPAQAAGFAIGLQGPGPADLDRDGSIGMGDLERLFAAWGDCGCTLPCEGDLNNDGEVNGRDLGSLLSNWN